MRRKLVVGMTICVAAGVLGPMTVSVATAASSSGRRVTVEPRLGSPSTTFTVRFRAPDRSGRVGGQERYYVVSAAGPSGDGSCVGQSTSYAGASRAHARVRVKLRPGAASWCSGTFHGSVTEQARPACPYREVCPLYIVLVKTIGRFSFRVQSGPPRADTEPPVFGGLQSATTCSPGPERPGETTRYHLSWTAAHDNMTPRAELVYDVFTATAPGTERFSQPNWTTAAGATRFTTPDLPENQPAYFIVRARDRSGNEDHNHVERQGVDPCL